MRLLCYIMLYSDSIIYNTLPVKVLPTYMIIHNPDFWLFVMVENLKQSYPIRLFQYSLVCRVLRPGVLQLRLFRFVFSEFATDWYTHERILLVAIYFQFKNYNCELNNFIFRRHFYILPQYLFKYKLI